MKSWFAGILLAFFGFSQVEAETLYIARISSDAKLEIFEWTSESDTVGLKKVDREFSRIELQLLRMNWHRLQSDQEGQILQLLSHVRFLRTQKDIDADQINTIREIEASKSSQERASLYEYLRILKKEVPLEAGFIAFSDLYQDEETNARFLVLSEKPEDLDKAYLDFLDQSSED